MDWDVLIPILMFLFPLVVSILDKRAKKRKGVPPVKAEPLFPPAEDQTDREFPSEDRSHPRLRKREGPAAEGSGRDPATPDVFRGELPIRSPQEGKPDTFVMEATQTAPEGQRAVERHIDTAAQDDDKPKLEIDKKKLILYSEILKPKFDA